MSFGFAIGDFIVVADKARRIYRKCKSAPDEYAILAHHIDVLAKVLEDTQAFLNKGAPPSNLKIEALASACEGCRTTLKEVEEFLNKYADVAKKKNRRYIQLGKFIAQDVDGLKAKLGNNTSLLHLSLTSLSNLSATRVEAALQTILREYQTGKRQPSVLSDAVLERKSADQDDLLQQVSDDLEDKDVHPDAIDLNQSTIRSWLAKVLVQGDLEEGPSCSHPRDPGESSASPAKPSGPSKFPTSIESNKPPNAVDTPGNGNENAQIHDLGESSSPTMEEQPEIEVSSAPQPKAPESHVSFPGLVSHSPSDLVEREITGPSDPERVYKILLPLIEIDPDIDYDSVAASHRISQAFYQQDWSHRGLLTRKEVLGVCEGLIKKTISSGTKIQALDPLPNTVYAFDKDRDGQFDQSDYSGLMNHLIREIIKTRHRLALARIGDKLNELQADSRETLPWRWPKGSKIKNLPPMSILFGGREPESEWIAPSSFTAMSLRADNFVNKIIQYEEKWLVKLPKNFQIQFTETLRTARAGALAFTLFENRKNMRLLSDLDAILICYRLLRSHLNAPIYHKLKQVQATSYNVLCSISIFMHFLPYLWSTTSPTKNQAEDLVKHWKSNHIAFLTRRMTEKLHKWDSEVVSEVSNVRQDQESCSIQSSALNVARSRVSKAATRVQDYVQSVHLNVEFGRFTLLAPAISKINTRKVYLEVTIDDPPQTWRSNREKLDSDNWARIYQDSPSLKIRIGSRITIKVFDAAKPLLNLNKKSEAKEGIQVFDSPLWSGISEWEKCLPLETSALVQTFEPLKKLSDQLVMAVSLDETHSNLRKEYERMRPHWTNLLQDNRTGAW